MMKFILKLSFLCIFYSQTILASDIVCPRIYLSQHLSFGNDLHSFDSNNSCPACIQNSSGHTISQLIPLINILLTAKDNYIKYMDEKAPQQPIQIQDMFEIRRYQKAYQAFQLENEHELNLAYKQRSKLLFLRSYLLKMAQEHKSRKIMSANDIKLILEKQNLAYLAGCY